MKVLLKRVDKPLEIAEIENELSAMQELVGGYIEVARTGLKGAILVCDEDGKFKGKPANIITDRDVIVGDVFFCSVNGEEFSDITQEQIDAIVAEWFA